MTFQEGLVWERDEARAKLKLAINCLEYLLACQPTNELGRYSPRSEPQWVLAQETLAVLRGDK